MRLVAILVLVALAVSVVMRTDPATQKPPTLSHRSPPSPNAHRLETPTPQALPAASTPQPSAATATNLQQAPAPDAKPVTPATQFVFVTGSRVNIRDGQGTQNRRLGSFPKGTKLVLQEAGPKWSRVSGNLNGEPVSGWMAASYLSQTPPATPAAVPAKPKRSVAAPTNAEIRAARQEIIRQSVASYLGSCPCPYNRDRAGRRCGGRSAWSRPGGYSPICYESDISDARLKTQLARVRGKNF